MTMIGRMLQREDEASAASIVFVGKLMVMRTAMSYSIVCCWRVDDTAARETRFNNNAVKSARCGRLFSQSLI